MYLRRLALVVYGVPLAMATIAPGAYSLHGIIGSQARGLELHVRHMLHCIVTTYKLGQGVDSRDKRGHLPLWS